MNKTIPIIDYFKNLPATTQVLKVEKEHFDESLYTKVWEDDVYIYFIKKDDKVESTNDLP